MNVIMIAAIVMLVLLFLKVPVFISLLSAALVYFIATPGNAMVFAQHMISSNESVAFLAIPFFALAGELMNYTGVTSRIMKFCKVITGRMYGGLAQVNVLLSTLMGGLSGSNIADATMEAKMLVPEMEKAGYSNAFSTVLTAVTSLITPLIPPGISMILYGCMAGVSIGKLFTSGISVGLILCTACMILVHFISKKRGYNPIRNTKLTGHEIWDATRPAILPLLLPIVIIGGIRIGIFTATEAGAVSIVYALILGIVYKEITKENCIKAVLSTCSTTCSIMMIVSAASVFSWVLTKEKIPQALTAWVVGTIDNKYVFLLVINVFLIIVGMFMEGAASATVLVPLLAPVAAAYGINEIQFAMVFIFNNSVGALTPPLGTLMFITCGVTKCKTKDFLREAIPFYILLFIVLMILTYVPAASTAIVDLIY